MLQYLVMLGLIVLLVVRELNHSSTAVNTPEPVLRVPSRVPPPGAPGAGILYTMLQTLRSDFPLGQDRSFPPRIYFVIIFVTQLTN